MDDVGTSTSPPPRPFPTMAQPHPSTLPREWPEKREWKTGLCDCSAGPDGSNRCCQTFWCAPAAFGTMSQNEDTPLGVPGAWG